MTINKTIIAGAAALPLFAAGAAEAGGNKNDGAKQQPIVKTSPSSHGKVSFGYHASHQMKSTNTNSGNKHGANGKGAGGKHAGGKRGGGGNEAEAGSRKSGGGEKALDAVNKAGAVLSLSNTLGEIQRDDDTPQNKAVRTGAEIAKAGVSNFMHSSGIKVGKGWGYFTAVKDLRLIDGEEKRAHGLRVEWENFAKEHKLTAHQRKVLSRAIENHKGAVTGNVIVDGIGSVGQNAIEPHTLIIKGIDILAMLATADKDTDVLDQIAKILLGTEDYDINKRTGEIEHKRFGTPSIFGISLGNGGLDGFGGFDGSQRKGKGAHGQRSYDALQPFGDVFGVEGSSYSDKGYSHGGERSKHRPAARHAKGHAHD